MTQSRRNSDQTAVHMSEHKPELPNWTKSKSEEQYQEDIWCSHGQGIFADVVHVGLSLLPFYSLQSAQSCKKSAMLMSLPVRLAYTCKAEIS